MKLNVMVIDGNKVALSSMKRMLAPYEYLHLTGSFLEPNQALATLESYPADVIFLDMDMQFINGLEVVGQISRICVNAQIVFMATKLDYAVEAFNLNVMDYLLKPVDASRLDQTIMKLLRRMEKR